MISMKDDRLRQSFFFFGACGDLYLAIPIKLN